MIRCWIFRGFEVQVSIQPRRLRTVGHEWAVLITPTRVEHRCCYHCRKRGHIVNQCTPVQKLWRQIRIRASNSPEFTVSPSSFPLVISVFSPAYSSLSPTSGVSRSQFPLLGSSLGHATIPYVTSASSVSVPMSACLSSS
ncbi:unnamed protein product [Gordionus sp. m RMFG-2023]